MVWMQSDAAMSCSHFEALFDSNGFLHETKAPRGVKVHLSLKMNSNLTQISCCATKGTLSLWTVKLYWISKICLQMKYFSPLGAFEGMFELCRFGLGKFVQDLISTYCAVPWARYQQNPPGAAQVCTEFCINPFTLLRNCQTLIHKHKQQICSSSMFPWHEPTNPFYETVGINMGCLVLPHLILACFHCPTCQAGLGLRFLPDEVSSLILSTIWTTLNPLPLRMIPVNLTPPPPLQISAPKGPTAAKFCMDVKTHAKSIAMQIFCRKWFI